MTTIARQHQDEVEKGERFEFGKNWERFLANLTVVRIKLAETSLKTCLGSERLDGKTFLDVGSGSGLFSLAARRLGATVHSFDYDTQSVACTRELRRRFFKDDPNWVVEQGSVLDTTYLKSLGTFDVVYSWGVLHHTGAMWQALENVKPLVAMNGQLFIAIYNDQGEITDGWAQVKQIYNTLPRPFAYMYALGIIAVEEAKHLANHWRHGTTKDWLRTWTEYDLVSMRGMSRWHDWIDWIGGYPYERATIEPIVDIYAKDGFRVTKLFDCSGGYGCNEFVLRREAPLGTFIDSPIPGGGSMARQFGRRVLPPFERSAGVLTGAINDTGLNILGEDLYLIRDNTIVDQVNLLTENRVSLGSIDNPHDFIAKPHYIVVGKIRPLTAPFLHQRGHMWEKSLPDLSRLADRVGDDKRSNVFVFEDRRQLPQPHVTHDSVALHGAGRFSHWGTSLYFSTLDNSDPNTNAHRYELFIAAQSLPLERSCAQRFGRPIVGPFEHTSEGWMTIVQDQLLFSRNNDTFLLRNEKLVGPVSLDNTGRLLIAPRDEDERTLLTSQLYLVTGTLRVLAPPFSHERGLMWSQATPEFVEVSDIVGNNRSKTFVFENGFQLPDPHSPHEDIAKYGAGRFSHWESHIFLSSSDGSDPNANGRLYQLLTPA